VDVAGAALVVAGGRADRSSPEQPARTRQKTTAAVAARRTPVSVGRLTGGADGIGSLGGMARTATAVWRIRPELVLALAERLGEPVDRYVNGSQTWFTETPGGVALEWRLHPVAGYVKPKGLGHDEVWDVAVESQIGEVRLRPEEVWGGLECFAAYGDDIEPATLGAAAAQEIGLAPDATGLVDHESIGNEWERTRGAVSIIDLLLAQLAG
jgi:hypothetical protein